MSFSNIDTLNLGNLLQIVFSDGVRNQISVDFRDFEMVKRAKVGNSVARELRFMFQTALVPALSSTGILVLLTVLSPQRNKSRLVKRLPSSKN